MATIYIKLGPKAASFYDPSTGLQLAHGEVKEVDETLRDAPKVNKHLMAQGLKIVGESEHKAYLEALKQDTPVAKSVSDDNQDYIEDLETKTKEATEKAEEESEKRLAAEKKAIYYQIQAEYELTSDQEAELEKIKNNKSKLEDMLKDLEANAE